MSIKRINPEPLHETPGYHHVTIVESRRLACIAGQCPVDRPGAVVGLNDIEVQVDQVAANAAAALTTAGARPEHVVRSVINVASKDQSVFAAVWRRFNTSAIAAAFTTASTLLGVAQLGSAVSSSNWTSRPRWIPSRPSGHPGPGKNAVTQPLTVRSLYFFGGRRLPPS